MSDAKTSPRDAARSFTRLGIASSMLAVAVGTGTSPFFLERGSGWLALTLTIVTLAITPARRVLVALKRPVALLSAIGLQRARRALGLSAALAAAFHALLAGLRYFGSMDRAVLDALYDLAWLRQGAVALGLLGILALTSIRPLARHLRAWSSLHRLLYPAALLAALHALLGPHAGVGALAGLAFIALLLLARLVPTRSRLDGEAAQPRERAALGAPHQEDPDAHGLGGIDDPHE